MLEAAEDSLWGFGRATPAEAGRMAPLALAYLGDVVYELYVRNQLLRGPELPPKELHRLAVRRVKASAQAEALRHCAAGLPAEEAEVVKRGRNARVQVAKGASPADQHYSTAFEALIGYLYLTGRTARLRELLTLAFAGAGEMEQERRQ